MSDQQLSREIADGQAIYLKEAARLFPPHRRGRPVSLSCVFRWIIHGTAGPDGQRVRLDGARLPAGWVTTRAAISRFTAALTPHLADGPPPAIRSPGARMRASERAARELERIGI